MDDLRAAAKAVVDRIEDIVATIRVYDMEYPQPGETPGESARANELIARLRDLESAVNAQEDGQ